MMRLFEVTLTGENGSRVVRVPSPTGVQAGDAAVSLALSGEAIGDIIEVENDGEAPVDSAPPLSQAAELAPVTPGAAAAPLPSQEGETR